MTEVNQVAGVARRHLAPYGRLVTGLRGVEPGVPDTYYNLLSVPGWYECKVIPANGSCPDHFTKEQLMWGMAEVAAGGRWHLLGRCGPRWRLYDVPGAMAWRAGNISSWLLDISGRFPMREIIEHLAPRELRRVSCPK
jgi:hypothetical protein